MPEDYALNLEEMKRMMANARGTNLAGQSMQGQSQLVKLRTANSWRYADGSKSLHQALAYSPDNGWWLYTSRFKI